MDSSVHLFLIDVWLCFLGLFLTFYVLLDGFDLGIGVLSLFVREEDRRGIMMASLGSVWDANESWLVVLGGMHGVARNGTLLRQPGPQVDEAAPRAAERPEGCARPIDLAVAGRTFDVGWAHRATQVQQLNTKGTSASVCVERLPKPFQARNRTLQR